MPDHPSAAPARTLRLGLFQHACSVDPDANTVLACDMIRDAAGQGAQLVVTPELFRSLYFCNTEDPETFDLAEPIPGPTTQTLGELADELNICISASIFERRAAGIYHNTSVLLGADGQIRGKYRKMHIPDDPSYLEKYYFTPGDLGFSAHPLSDKLDAPRVGMLVCWDQWFPEAARLTAMQGAELLLYPTAIGGHKDDSPEEHAAQRDAWTTIQRSHAIANGVFVAAPNRIGTEGPNTFWGQSFIADPLGRILAQASTDQPEILVADLDLNAVEYYRRTWNLFFRDRRIDAYGGLLQQWGS